MRITVRVTASLLEESVDYVNQDAWHEPPGGYGDKEAMAYDPPAGSLRSKLQITSQDPNRGGRVGVTKHPYAFITGKSEDVNHALMLLAWAAELATDTDDSERRARGRRWTKSMEKMADQFDRVGGPDYRQFAVTIREGLKK